MNKGYRKIRPLEGGLDAWIDAGGAVTQYTLER
jgi:3-mercaptopyruvate sulfurtransferase SseA